MNINTFTLLKKIVTFDYQVLVLKNLNFEKELFFITRQFTPSQGQTNQFYIEGLDITPLVDSNTLFTNLNPNMAFGNNSMNYHSQKELLETKLSEIKTTILRLSPDWSYMWILK